MAHIGLQIPGFSYGVPDDRLFETVAGAARAAEDAGFDSVWVMDHFEQLPMLGGVDEPILEGYTTLAALAARTSKVFLGTLVTGVTYRNPALLAKMVTTLDVISAGRAILGIGAAWFEEEHEAYGYGPLLPAGERLDRMEEAIEICRRMFTEERASFEGRYYRIHEARNLPQPVQPGGPRILIGGSGEKRTLRAVARFGDFCNLFGGPAQIRRKLDVLDKHCSEVGRDPSEITRTGLLTVIIAPTQEAADVKRDAMLGAMGLTEEQASEFAVFGGPERIAEHVAERRAAGLDGMIVNLGNADVADPELVALAGEALKNAFA